MSEVLMYERATPSFASTLAHRGHHIVYRANADNHCPDAVGRNGSSAGSARNAVSAARPCRSRKPSSTSMRRPALQKRAPAPLPAPRNSGVSTACRRRAVSSRSSSMDRHRASRSTIFRRRSDGRRCHRPFSRRERLCPLRRRNSRARDRQVGRGRHDWAGVQRPADARPLDGTHQLSARGA